MTNYHIHFEQCPNPKGSNKYNYDWRHMCEMSYSADLCHMTTLIPISGTENRRGLTSGTKFHAEETTSVWVFNTAKELETVTNFAIEMRDTVQNAKHKQAGTKAGPYDKLIHLYNLVPEIYTLLEAVTDTKCRVILIQT